MKYRPEIDGLRALAVVPVILFHAGFELFSGGFVGVDIFFVISGYLITSILVDDIENKRFSIVNFYERRARRILPALIFVMLVCIPFAWMWMLPSQMKDFTQSLAAVSFFASNFLFWHQSGYFEAAAEVKPLLHTWSLAVEEQYYLLFPIFLIAAWRIGKNRVFWMIVIFAIISLGLSEWGRRSMPMANFYLAPTRAWELLAGSIAAFVVYKRGVRANNALSLLGLAAILFAIFAYDTSTPFPSVYALVPVIGVVLLVLFAEKETLAAKFLRTRLFVGIGLISYSAYLWHQPLFAFARLKNFEAPTEYLMLSLVLASLGLALISWKFIEQPLRSRECFSRKSIFFASAFFCIAFTLIDFVGLPSGSYENRLTQEQIEMLAYDKYPGGKFYREGDCLLQPEQSANDFGSECLLDKGYLVWGDSHAAALASGLRLVVDNVSQLTASTCPPILDIVIAIPPRPYCLGINRHNYELLKKNPDFVVLLHANWRLYQINHDDYLRNTIKRLREIGVEEIIIIGGVPQYMPSLPEVLLSERVVLDKPHSSRFRSQSVKDVDHVLSVLAESLDVGFMSALNVFCESEKCVSVIKGSEGYVPTAWDYGHLTLEGSVYLSKHLFPYRVSSFQ